MVHDEISIIHYFFEINYEKETMHMKTGMEILRLAGRLSAKFIIWLAARLEK